VGASLPELAQVCVQIVLLNDDAVDVNEAGPLHEYEYEDDFRMV
jgi:hypothetical protein